jgi:hypothetical protein
MRDTVKDTRSMKMDTTAKLVRNLDSAIDERFTGIELRLLSLMDGQQRALEQQVKEERRTAELKRALVANYSTAFRSWLRTGWTDTAKEPGISPEMRALLLRGENRDGMTVGKLRAALVARIPAAQADSLRPLSSAAKSKRP